MSTEEAVTPQNPELRLRKESSSPGEKQSPQVGLEGGKEKRGHSTPLWCHLIKPKAHPRKAWSVAEGPVDWEARETTLAFILLLVSKARALKVLWLQATEVKSNKNLKVGTHSIKEINRVPRPKEVLGSPCREHLDRLSTAVVLSPSCKQESTEEPLRNH